jgi:hypothetical protein
MPSALVETVQKRIDDAIWTTFAEAYHKANVCYEEDRLDECIEQCSEVLGTVSCPQYIRISTLILLALVVESEEDFRAARTEAGM